MKKQAKLITLIALALVVAMSACLFVGCSPKESQKATVTGVYTGARTYSKHPSVETWYYITTYTLTLYSNNEYMLAKEEIYFDVSVCKEMDNADTVLFGTYTEIQSEGETTIFDVTLSAPTRVFYQGKGYAAQYLEKEFCLDTEKMSEADLKNAAYLANSKDSEYKTVEEAKNAVLTRYGQTRVAAIDKFELDRNEKLYNRIVTITEQK